MFIATCAYFQCLRESLAPLPEMPPVNSVAARKNGSPPPSQGPHLIPNVGREAMLVAEAHHGSSQNGRP